MRRTEPQTVRNPTVKAKENAQQRAIAATYAKGKQQIEVALWQRFVKEAVEAGEYQPSYLRTYRRAWRRELIRQHLGERPGKWQFRLRSVFEADIIAHGFTTTGPPMPTEARPASREKIDILAARVAAGCSELHSPDDANVFCSPYEQGARQKIYKNPDIALADPKEAWENKDADNLIGD